MTSLDLFEPRSLDEAISQLAQHGDDARVIAGGTALVLMLKNRLIAPSALIITPRRAAAFLTSLTLDFGTVHTSVFVNGRIWLVALPARFFRAA